MESLRDSYLIFYYEYLLASQLSCGIILQNSHREKSTAGSIYSQTHSFRRLQHRKHRQASLTGASPREDKFLHILRSWVHLFFSRHIKYLFNGLPNHCKSCFLGWIQVILWVGYVYHLSHCSGIGSRSTPRLWESFLDCITPTIQPLLFRSVRQRFSWGPKSTYLLREIQPSFGSCR